MKSFLSIGLAVVCVVLVVALALVKHSDDAQHETDAANINDFSNQLTTAQSQITAGNQARLTLSSSLDECREAMLTLSNRLIEAQAAAADAAQVPKLNRQITDLKSENEALLQTTGQRIADLTNQVSSLTNQLVLTRADLGQANKDYALLENRLRRDVAERLVVERKFNNPAQLQAQLDRLKNNPGEAITAESIYAGLDVEVSSNSFHVISPN